MLRPTGAVAALYRQTQRRLLDALPHAVPHPHTEHATLRGFFEPERRDAVAATIREWAAHQHPIELAVDAIDAFPSPWQIVIARLARTDALVAAYASLTDALAETGFRRLEERPLEEWTFHLSVLYGKTLDAATWAPFAASAVRELPDGPACTVAEAELVSYVGGVERAEVFPLG